MDSSSQPTVKTLISLGMRCVLLFLVGAALWVGKQDHVSDTPPLRLTWEVNAAGGGVELKSDDNQGSQGVVGLRPKGTSGR